MKRFTVVALMAVSVLALRAQTDVQVTTSTAPTQVVSLAPTTTFYTSNAAMSTNQASSSFIIRSGRNYIYNNEVMRGKAYEEFLRTNCTAAYMQYRSGRNVTIAGWTMLGGGLAMEAGVVIGLIVTGQTGQLHSSSVNAGTICYLAGGAIFVASIPTLLVGYSRQHKSADTFNLVCRPQPTAYWSVQADENGLGLALHF